MKSNLPLIYSLVTAAIHRPGSQRMVRCGVVVEQNGKAHDEVRTLAEAYGMTAMSIAMTDLQDDGSGVRSVRAIVTEELADATPTLIVLEEANDAQGEMLRRAVQAIDEAAKGRVIILAVGNARGDVAMMARDVADGMRTNTEGIVGSPAFMERMDALFGLA